MDAKDLRTETALGDRMHDGTTKHPQSMAAPQCNRNKPYQDMGSNSLGKVDAPPARPCAVIGPDRVVPPSVTADAYLKKAIPEQWQSIEAYRRPPEYPHRISEYHPNRNISPRQTFQENMQRIMVPPSYNSVKIKEDHNFPVDPNTVSLRNTKLNMPPEAKYSDVPYTVNAISNEQKSARHPDISVPSMNPALARSVPHAWPAGTANVRVQKPYSDMYPYSEYSSCNGPRPMLIPRPHGSIHEEAAHAYPEPQYYHEGNIRYKPYPSPKERVPQARFDYLSYSNPFHPPPFPTHKYEIQKSIPHPYSGYSQVPLKYIDTRMAEPIMNGYQRPLNQQTNYNTVSYRNQIMHPTYGPVPGNCIQPNKFYTYSHDNSVKTIAQNKLPYENSNKMYTEYDNTRLKPYPLPDSFYVNEMGRSHPIKSLPPPPSYASVNMQHALPPHPYYRKENQSMKGYDYSPHFRNVDPTSINMGNNALTGFPSQYAANAITISPSDSNTGNDALAQGILQDEFGYVNQSSSVSMRNIDLSMNRIPNDFYGRYDYRYGPPMKNTPTISKLESNSSNHGGNKNKKDINVRQFLSMWSEDDNGENNKEIHNKHTLPNNTVKHYDNNNQEQLYVLGLVNVPREELSKYEHIQKVSKLPENIKGYNSIELLNQFEEVIESSNLNHFKSPVPEQMKNSSSLIAMPARPISPLDVEAKISQSVIHKEVGCNFEIRPCSPKMLNVEIATPAQNLLGERLIEKVSNPLILPSPNLPTVDLEINNCNVTKHPEHRNTLNKNIKAPSCKMVNTQCNEAIGTGVKSSYSVQDLESNSGICLASLPRLDNDCELNFPEVNQQFINANKTESVIISTPKDLPTLEVGSPGVKVNTQDKDVIIENFSSNTDSEKNAPKLSKYRKYKKSKDNLDKSIIKTQSQTIIRTDSVIIKNPENVKIQDESIDKTVQHQKDQDIPINLTLHPEERSLNYGDATLNEAFDGNPSIDTILDFSSKPIQYQLLKSDSKIVETDIIHPNELNNKTMEYFEYKDESHRTSEIESTSDIQASSKVQTDCVSVSTSESSIIKNTINEDNHNVNSKLSNTIEDLTDCEDNYNSSMPGQLENNATPDNKSGFSCDKIRCLSPLSSNDSDFDRNCISDNVDKNECPANQCEIADINQEIIHYNKSNTITNESSDLDCKLNTIKENVINPFVPCKKLIPGTEIFEEEFAEMSQSNLNSETPLSEPKNESINARNLNFYKKHFSSRMQNLFMYIEGCCCTFTTKKCYRCNSVINYIELKDTETDGAKLDFVDETNDDSRKLKLEESSLVASNITSENEVLNLEEVEGPESILKSTKTQTPFTESMHNIANDLNSTESNSTEIHIDEHINSSVDCVDIMLDKNISVDLNITYDQPINEINEKASEDSTIKEKIKTDTGENNSVNDINMSSEICDQLQSDEIIVKEIHGDESIHDTLHNTDSSDNTRNEFPETDQFVCNTAIEIKENISENYLGTEKSILNSDMPDTRLCISVSNTTSSIASNESDSASEPKMISSDVVLKNHPENKTVFLNSNKRDQKDESAPDTKHENNLFSEIYDSPCNKNSPKDNAIAEQDADNEEIKVEAPCNNSEFTENVCSINNDTTTETISNVINETICMLPRNEDLKHVPDPVAQSMRESSLVNEMKTSPEGINSEESSFLVNESSGATDDCVCAKTDNVIATSDILTDGSCINDNSDYSHISFIKSTETISEIECEITEEQKVDHESEDQLSQSNDLDLDNQSIHIESAQYSRHENTLPNENNVYEKTDSAIDDDDNNSGSFDELNETHEIKTVDIESIPEVSNATDSISQNTLNPTVTHSKCSSLKRSLSDSALDKYQINFKHDVSENGLPMPKKRRIDFAFENSTEPQFFPESFCNSISHNRRNSISSVYNEENVSFCIVIDNDCLITADESDKICFADISISENCIPCTSDETTSEDLPQLITIQEDTDCSYAESFVVDTREEENEAWVDDVACVETVVSDDIAEDIVVSAASSPKSTGSSDDETNDNETIDVNLHCDKVKYIYGEKMCRDDAQFVDTLYRTPQMDVNKTLIYRETHISDDCHEYYNTESLEEVLSETYEASAEKLGDNCSLIATTSETALEDKENFNFSVSDNHLQPEGHESTSEIKTTTNVHERTPTLQTQDDTVHSCESSVDNDFSYNNEIGSNLKCTILSSSPEVSSTTPEERNSILLKITNYGGSRVAQVNDIKSDVKRNTVSCKYTEKRDYIPCSSNLLARPLITKAAQKYIPPLKETLQDLKIKLPLPQHSLNKLKQLKVSKDAPKPRVKTQNAINMSKKETPKKPKPNFEDVLKSIDEIQFKMRKGKDKKIKKTVPKVVIKKSINGSHYTSAASKDKYNPDLTGRKWQPWVFIEKNLFIDKMAIKKKTKAVYNYRKKTYVLAESFKKYRSCDNVINHHQSFIISQPKTGGSCVSQLKYTIRIKQSY